jgi:hypothetical protein
MAYASTDDVAKRSRTLSSDEIAQCEQLLSDAGLIIDSYNKDASEDVKKLVSCNMVIRAAGYNEDQGGVSFPTGSTQGSMSAMGYAQSWTMGSGSTGELYLTKTEKRLLGVGNRIGAHSPLEDIND